MKKIKKNLGQTKNETRTQLEFEADKQRVANVGASFQVKYLGYEEVKEARGVKVCSNAVQKLLKDKKNKKKMMLKISMDGVRVADDISRVLILDQPIEKISFCAPDSQHPKLFSYIARDGASRRWLCYGFYAVNDPGERLSHALGCAFTACLQKKQKATKARESNSSNGSGTEASKDNSPSIQKSGISEANTPPFKTNTPISKTLQPQKSPMIKAATTTSIKRVPPKEITVPLPESLSRDRSATTIGMSTPPSNNPLSNPFHDNVNTGHFTADLADILLFDPNDNITEDTMARRARAHTEYPANIFDEFDPLNPQFKSMQFEDDFVPCNSNSFIPAQNIAKNTTQKNTTLPTLADDFPAAFPTFSNTNPFVGVINKTVVTDCSRNGDDFDLFANARVSQTARVSQR